MARKKKSGFNWILLIFIGFAIYYNFFDEEGSQTETAREEAVRVAQLFGNLTTYGMKGTVDAWPNLTGNSVSDQQDKLAKNYYVILDDSGSMKSDYCASGHETRLAAAIEALAAFAEGLPPEANFGVMSFDRGNFTQHVPLGRRGRDNLRNLNYQMVPEGGTPLLTAITRGYQVLQNQAVAQLGYGEYHLVVITDGAASDNQHPDAIVRRILQESPVDIHTIGFCIGSDHVLNQPRYLSYQSADNVEALSQGLRNVLAEAPAFDVSSFDR